MSSKFDRLRSQGSAEQPVGALDLVNNKANDDEKPKTSSVKSGKVTKKRRSFMLTEKQIRMLNTAKVNHPNVDITLSDIIGTAIEEYCSKKR